MYKIFLSLVAIISLSNLFVLSKILFVDKDAKNPEYPEHCHYKEDGHIFGVGQFYLPYGKEAGGCYSFECQSAGVIATHGCDPEMKPQGCRRLRRDLYTPFPHCCERYLCENKKGELVVINPSVRSDWAKLD